MSRKMKDSGVEWIGEIPEEWFVRRNKTVFGCSKEIVGSKSETEQLLSLTTNGVKEKSKDVFTGKVPESFDTYQTVKINDLVMCLFDLDCSAVFSGISPYDGMISPAYKILKSKDEMLPKYADYWFKFIFDGRKFQTYAKNLRYTLTYDEFAILPILLPKIDEQQKIADYLDKQCSELDTVIAKTRESIGEYKKLKQSVITQAVTKGVRGERKMKDSGIEWIGQIPKEWTIGKIKNGVSKVGSGKTPSGGAESYAEKGILFLRSQNVYDTGLVLDEPTYITPEIDEEMKNTRVYPRDVLLNITGGSIGRCCIFPEACERANVNQHVSIIRVIESVFLPEYMQYFWVSSLGRTAISLYQTGGNREGMSAEAIKNTPIPIISISEQKEIINYLNEKCMEMDSLINQKECYVMELENYKKSLIYEYVTGKKEVPFC